MSKIAYLQDYIKAPNSIEQTRLNLDNYEQLDLFPPPKLSDKNYYYIIDIKNETEDSLLNFFSFVKPTSICEMREVPNFFTGNLNRNKFFEIINSLELKYVYPDLLEKPTTKGICYLVDDVNAIDVNWLDKKLIELKLTKNSI